MIEAFLATQFGMLILALWPYLVALGSTIVTAVLAIKKVAQVINEFRNSNEVIELERQLAATVKDNAIMKHDFQMMVIGMKNDLNKLTAEITKRHPIGYTEESDTDDEDN